MVDPVSPGRMPWLKGRGMRIALAVSVTLNLIVVGVVAGAILRGPPGFEGQDREFSFGPFSDAMRPDERRALRKDLLQRAPGLRQMRQEMRADMDQVVAVMRADPFDPAALTAVMEAQQARLTGQITVGGQALRDFLVAMSNEDRHAFADRLEQRLKHKDRH